ncbi:OLC1v1005807C4 [Oldenlandia corymbosa var. corymbosa]|nr:OLC1v1005807C4 [Oldenlandia corymbosa var. corymbosa]
MEKYLVPAPPPSQNPKPISKRFQWRRNIIELNGKLDSKYRREISSLSMQSYAQVGAFPHAYHIDGGDLCPTHVHSIVGGSNPQLITMEGVSALEFDSKGIYLASVTKSGCLTVHDYEELRCRVNLKDSALKEDETKQVLHIATGQSLDVVRWNLSNQYEVACTSRRSGEVHIYDIGYVSSEPVHILKKRPTVGIHGCVVQKGLPDVAFSSNDDSRVLASDMHGTINVWDRRKSDFPCLHLTTNSTCTINSIKFNVDNQVIIGASKNGMIYMWDIRGGSSFNAFQNDKTAYYSPLASVKLSSELEKIGSLKAQSNIALKEILSIDLNPSCSHQLAFHLDDGWSGVFNVHNSQVTHIHCPPPPWLDGCNDLTYLSYMRKPSWLPEHSIYAVGSSSNSGLHLLDFYQDRTSPCHVDYNEDLQTMDGISGKHKRNIFIPLAEAVTACAAHPIHGAIVAGTKGSSLLLLSQEFIPYQETDDSSWI